MAYIIYNKFWESEVDGIVCKVDKRQNFNIYQLKLEVHDTYKKDEKLKTNFEPTDNSDVIKKSYLDEKLKKCMVIFHILKKITTSLNYNTKNEL